MSSLKVTPEDLLAGSETAFDLVIPKEVMAPGGKADDVTVRIAPLTIGVFQLILKAARSDSSLIPLLMIKESLIEPAMNLEQVKKLPLGVVTFLMGHIRDISGLWEKKNSMM